MQQAPKGLMSQLLLASYIWVSVKNTGYILSLSKCGIFVLGGTSSPK